MPPSGTPRDLATCLNNNDVIMTSHCCVHRQLSDALAQCKSNVAKEQLLATIRCDQCDNSSPTYMFKYLNNLQCRTVSDGRDSINLCLNLPQQPSNQGDAAASPSSSHSHPHRNVVSKGRRRPIKRALSWLFAVVLCPCWCFYQIARTQPDMDDKDQFRHDLSDDFCCPCYY